MWKPGTERPKKDRKSKPKGGSSNNKDDTMTSAAGLGKNKSTPNVKKLSSGTMNMRFMQRTSISPKQLQQQSPLATTKASPSAAAPHYDDVDMAEAHSSDASSQNGEEHEAPRFVVASAEDMYGPVIMGRRSFGGFRPAVEQMHQQSVAAIAKKKHDNRKRKRGKK